MRFITKILTTLALATALTNANAIEPFEVKDIQVEGLQRVELGTFFTTLPIRVGETLDDARVPSIIRAVFKTGNFDFVKLQKDGDTLKIIVAERPTISSIVISGNKVLKSEQLLTSMESAGIAKGEVLDSFILGQIEQAIAGQYHSNGHYNLEVKKSIAELSRNRIQLKITIKEGSSAKLKSINFVGNKIFSDEELLKQMELTTGGLFSFITDDTKYSSTQLESDLESIASYYKDRGYLQFTILPTQISLSQNQDDVYVTINVSEGDIYTINEIKFVGQLKSSEDVYRKLFPLSHGDKYSAAASTFAEEQIKILLGYSGYSFADVKTFPEILEETNEVDLTVLIQPGDRYYINNVSFTGNVTTDESVFRREVRLQEGRPLSSQLVDRSKLRLQRLAYVESVDVEVVKTEETGKANLEFEVKERNAAQVSASLGYNDFYGMQLQGELSHSNFLGQGYNFGLRLSQSKAVSSINLNFTDPYLIDDTIGLSTSLGYSTTDYSKLGISTGQQSIDSITLGNTLYIPISEVSSISAGFNYQSSTLNTPLGTRQRDQRILDFFELLGQDARFEDSVDFEILTATLGWQYSTHNRSLYPTDGTSHSIRLDVATPLGDVEYYKATYDFDYYLPISEGWVFLTRASLGYGDGLGDTDRIPYFANFYAGGSGSLRGFETNTIGPKSITREYQTVSVPSPIPGDNPTNVILPPENDLLYINNRYSVGGNAKFMTSFELIFPTPFVEENSSVRTSAFIDVGNVWDTKFDPAKFDGLGFLAGSDTVINDYSIGSDYRASYGIALQWYSPMGPLVFSISRPIKEQPFDVSETFSFTIGQTF